MNRRYRKNKLRVFIYVLIDPRDNAPRYVGASIDPLRRATQHVTFASHRGRHGVNRSVDGWVSELRSQGMWPRIQIVAGHRRSDMVAKAENEFIYGLSAHYGTLLNESNPLSCKDVSSTVSKRIVRKCVAIFEGKERPVCSGVLI